MNNLRHLLCVCFVFILLRYNSYTIKCTIVKYVIQWVFSLSKEFYNHHHYLIQNIFVTAEWNPIPIMVTPHSFLPIPLTKLLSVYRFEYSGHFTHVESYIHARVLSLSIILRFIHVVAYINISFFLWLINISLYRYCLSRFCLFTQLMDIWVVSTFYLWWIMLLWTFVFKFLFGHTFSILMGIHLVVELLDHMVLLFLSFWGIGKVFSKVTALFHIPISNVWGVQFLHILIFFFFSFFNYGHTSEYEVLSSNSFICIPVMTNDGNIFSCAYWPFVYFLWSISSNTLPI